MPVFGNAHAQFDISLSTHHFSKTTTKTHTMAKKKRHSLAGKFCSIKSKTQRQKIDPNYELPDGAAGHMVIVFNTPNGYNKAEVASVSTLLYSIEA